MTRLLTPRRFEELGWLDGIYRRTRINNYINYIPNKDYIKDVYVYERSIVIQFDNNKLFKLLEDELYMNRIFSKFVIEQIDSILCYHLQQYQYCVDFCTRWSKETTYMFLTPKDHLKGFVRCNQATGGYIELDVCSLCMRSNTTNSSIIPKREMKMFNETIVSRYEYSYFGTFIPTYKLFHIYFSRYSVIVIPKVWTSNMTVRHRLFNSCHIPSDIINIILSYVGNPPDIRLVDKDFQPGNMCKNCISAKLYTELVPYIIHDDWRHFFKYNTSYRSQYGNDQPCMHKSDVDYVLSLI
jgi:hypothetical protein